MRWWRLAFREDSFCLRHLIILVAIFAQDNHPQSLIWVLYSFDLCVIKIPIQVLNENLLPSILFENVSTLNHFFGKSIQTRS
jgi:hypothetical protein